MASPQFKGGQGRQGQKSVLYKALGPRYAKYLDAVLENPDLHDLSLEVTALRARTLELFERTHRGDSEEQAKQAVSQAQGLRKHWADLKSAQVKASNAKQAFDRATSDADRARAQKELELWSAKASEIYAGLDGLLGEHETTLKANQDDWKTWNAVLETSERTATLVDKQDKRLQRARWFYTWLEVQRMFRALIESVNRHCRRCPECGHSLAKILEAVQKDWTSTTLAFYSETEAPIDMKQVGKEIVKYEAANRPPS